MPQRLRDETVGGDNAVRTAFRALHGGHLDSVLRRVERVDLLVALPQVRLRFRRGNRLDPGHVNGQWSVVSGQWSMAVARQARPAQDHDNRAASSLTTDN